MNANFASHLDAQYKKLTENLRVKPRDFLWRKSQLLALKKMIVENVDLLNEAMWKDLHKSPFESQATEQGIVLSEIEFALSHLEDWMEPESVATPLFNQIGSSQIVHDPYGLVLVIGAWNYPINLLLSPVVGAISGGNAVFIKPSEISVNTGHLIAALIPKYMDTDLFQVVEGGPEETGLLLDKKFDLIFFTGSGPVGKIVLQKAAPNLTPVILELGGKSPALVLPDADLKVTAKRLTWGKFMNAGQTCVAPDYILVHPSIRDELIREIQAALHQFYGDKIKDNPDYCRIVNAKNFDRLLGLLDGCKVLHGGTSDKEALFIEPTLLAADDNARVMQEEIFGPLWPILSISEVEEMIQFVNARPKPLALYIFGKDQDKIDLILEKTSSGGVSVNDVIMHMASPDLPFGGVGASGMGHYHGKYSFRTFTHAKSVLQKSTWVDVPVRYAPYTDTKLTWLKRLFR